MCRDIPIATVYNTDVGHRCGLNVHGLQDGRERDLARDELREYNAVGARTSSDDRHEVVARAGSPLCYVGQHQFEATDACHPILRVAFITV